ncbi:MAG: TetR family transcriptional regulator [Acidimicrobiales bacterium]|nr:TetR family transcriptional regulator [Acidimicrobiales bacterium]
MAKPVAHDPSNPARTSTLVPTVNAPRARVASDGSVIAARLGVGPPLPAASTRPSPSEDRPGCRYHPEPMDRPLSRRESQAVTRERLLEVAGEQFFEHGYRSTSLERVAELAGFSKGAVYSNFNGKDELVLAVLDHHFANRLVDLQRALGSSPETVEDRVATFSQWWELMVGDQGWGVLILEVASATRDRAWMRREMASRERMIIGFVANMIQEEAERFSVELLLPAADLASVMVSVGEGLAFSRMLENEAPTSLVADLVRLVFLGRR